MPRVIENEVVQKNRTIRAVIAKNMALLDLSDEDVAIKLHCVKRTFQNKKRDPETFTLEELRRLAKALKFSDEEKAMIL